MARFAKLGLNSKVEEIYLVDDSIAINEKAGIEYLQKLFNNYPFWKQSFTDGTRKNPAGKGMIYDDDRDAFRAKYGPYSSWVLNETNSPQFISNFIPIISIQCLRFESL